jgi:hypothetical protein
MGYSIRQNARLEFEGDEWVDEETGERLEVLVRLDFTLGQFFELQRAMRPIAEATDDPTSPEAEESLRTAIRNFGDRVLVGWNLTRDTGDDVPATADGAEEVPLRLITAIFTVWSKAVTAHMGVPPDDPLPAGSPNGEPSQAASETTAR